VPLYVARQGARGLNAQRLGDTTTTLLVRAGVRGQAAGEALRVLIVYTIGFVTRAPIVASDDRPPSSYWTTSQTGCAGYSKASCTQHRLRPDRKPDHALYYLTDNQGSVIGLVNNQGGLPPVCLTPCL